MGVRGDCSRNAVMGLVQGLLILGASVAHADEVAVAAAAPTTSSLAAPADPASTPSAPAPSSSGSQQLDTVVVTAQKRKQNLSDVPISISVISGDQLQKKHVEDYADLTREVPDLSFTAAGGSGMSNIEIRGVSSYSGTATVGTYLDDVSMTVPNTLDIGATEPNFFDIEQVEVLRGPQGTLYGASSMGGTIRFTSRQPDPRHQELNLMTDLSYTEHGGFNHLEQGIWNVPVSPGTSALRLGVQYSQQDGYIDQLSPALASDGVTPLPQSVVAKNINGERNGVFRGAFKYESGGLSVVPALYYQRNDSDNTDLFDVDTYLQTAKLVAESSSDSFLVPSLTIKDDLHWADLTSVSSFFWRHYHSVRDGTSFNSAYLAELLAADTVLTGQYPGVDPSPVAVRPGPAYFIPNLLQGSEEFRLASKSMKESGRPYDWIAGLYVAGQHAHLSDDEYIDNGIETVGNLYGTSGAAILIQNLTDPVDAGGAGLSLAQAQLDLSSGNDFYFNESSQDQRQASLFGELNYAPWKRLTLTGGLRYLVARTGVENRSGGYYNADAPSEQDAVSHAYTFTPKASVRYQLTPNASIYATAVKGFRLGGANQQIPYYGCHDDEVTLGVSAPPLTYGPDSLWSYELGSKSTLLGNRLSVEGAVYYIDWKKVQQQIFLPNCGFDYTENAGNARSYGVDLSIRGKLTRHITASLSGSDTQASITQAVVGSGATDGSKLLGVPSWMLTPALSYSGALSDTVQGNATVDWSWTGPSHGAFTPDDLDYQRPTYSVLNASFGLSLKGGIDIGLYAKNLLDEGKIIQHVERLDVSQAYVVRPRTLGLTLSKDF